MIDSKDFTISEFDGYSNLDKYIGNQEKVTIPDGVERIGFGAFKGCEGVKEVFIPGSIKIIAARAFQDLDSLEHVVFSEGLNTIEHEAFRACKNLKEAILPDSLKTLEYAVFYNCENLEKIRFGKKLKAIENNILYNNVSIQKLVIPDTIQKVGQYGFSGIKGITSLYVESNLKNKKIYVIDCPNLSEITFAREIPDPKGVNIVCCPLVDQVTIGNNVYKIVVKDRVGKLVVPDSKEKPTPVDSSTPLEFFFDEKMGMFVCECKGLLFSVDHEPDEKAGSTVRMLAENYHSHLNKIIRFMLPDLKEIYGKVTAKTAVNKLGRPVIEFESGRVMYLEHSFDEEHIFEFEFLDEEFEELVNFNIDG